MSPTRAFECENNTKILQDRGLPLPPYLPVLRLRFVMGNLDWWAKTPKGWYWLRTQNALIHEWKHAPVGPPGTHWEDM